MSGKGAGVMASRVLQRVVAGVRLGAFFTLGCGQETLWLRLQKGRAANGAVAGRLTQCRSAAKPCSAERLRLKERQLF